MADRPKKVLRCAVYTRKSSEEGLEQEFNSLHAQREACLAFIASQKHEGWTALPTRYDDGGISGGTMERPALQQLLADVAAGQIDVVVVYKIDRLTRSLLDFAKIVEIFDKRSVSFVSVTQQFSTTSSMGRLTLNVLLSFAQFEREVTGERIRDKIAASKKKGMWMGGYVPLGYRSNERTLAVEPEEATTVRSIFDLYLDLKNVRLVEAELRRRGVVTKRYVAKSGKRSGGAAFSRGHIYRVLANPLYAGDIEHKGVRNPGLHPPIVERKVFDEVQGLLANNGHKHRTRATANQTSLLAGLLFLEDGIPLHPTHAGKRDRRYRYYVSRPSADADDGSIGSDAFRIPGFEIEALVIQQLVGFITDEHRLITELRGELDGMSIVFTEAKKLAVDLASGSASVRRAILSGLVDRISIGPQNLRIDLKRDALLRRLAGEFIDDGDGRAIAIEVDVNLARRGVETRLAVPGPSTDTVKRSPDAALLKAVARAHVWFEELTSGRARSIIEIARRESVSDRFVSIVLELAFLAPDALDAVTDGRQFSDLTAKGLMFSTRIQSRWGLQFIGPYRP
jgi:DNA invertase Pin-like site-specific DNA recombinase